MNRNFSVICFIAGLSLACSSPGTETLPADLEGRPVAFFQAGQRVAVLFFISGDCPISNRYAPEIRRICQSFGDRGADCWLVYPDSADTPESIRRHLREFGFAIDAVRDPGRVLTSAARATVTPEAAVFVPGPDGGRKLAYHGRIDDRFADFGMVRSSPGSHDLEFAIEAVLKGEPVKNEYLPAVGCYIPKPNL